MPYIGVLKKYAIFDGRSPRPEFWWFMLGHVIIALLAGFVDNGVFPTLPLEQRPIMSVYLAITLLPAMAVGARRLHDIGRSGLLQLVFYVPWVATAILAPWFEYVSLIGLMVSGLGFIVLSVFTARPSQPEENQYRHPPATA